MKRIFIFLAPFAAQAATAVLMARVVRLQLWQEHLGIPFTQVLVFGMADVVALTGYLWFVFRPTLSAGRLIKSISVALVLSCVGHALNPLIVLKTNNFLVKRYIAQMQPRLDSDRRFSQIKLRGMSCDYVTGYYELYPYIPVAGNVGSEEDRQSLLHLLRSANPPAHIDAVVVKIGNVPPSMQEFLRREREEDKVP